jgi:hypothetical protein
MSTAKYTYTNARVEYDPKNLPEGVFLWEIDDAQADRISSLLKIDFPTLGIAGNFVYGAPAKCRSCGKLSGLDDFIYTGLKMAAHKPEFMIKALTERMPSSSEQLPHTLDCCLCNTTYIETSDTDAPRSIWNGFGLYQYMGNLLRSDGGKTDPSDKQAKSFLWPSCWTYTPFEKDKEAQSDFEKTQPRAKTFLWPSCWTYTPLEKETANVTAAAPRAKTFLWPSCWTYTPFERERAPAIVEAF